MDRFRPNLPLDPFDQLEPALGHASWHIDAEKVASASSARPRDVILVVGDTEPEHLRPIFDSERLSASLVILATSSVEDASAIVPTSAYPVVRILRLHSPLAPHDGGGAARFIAVLEWAERVARVWRTHGDAGKPLYERFEEDDELLVGIAGAVPPLPSSSLSQRSSSSSLRSAWLTPPSLSHGSSPLPSPTATPRSSMILPSSSAASISSRRTSKLPTPKPRRVPALPAADPAQRPFDSLISFVPAPSHYTPPKALLKHAIVVTTLSRPFLTVPARPHTRNSVSERTLKTKSVSSITLQDTSRRRWSFFGSVSAASSPYPTPAPSPKGADAGSAHIVHALAAPDASLVRAIEAFVLNFADAGLAQAEARGVPFVVDAPRLADVVRDPHGGFWNVAHLLLAGALDPRGGGPKTALSALSRRAWVAGAPDIAVGLPISPVEQYSPTTPRSHVQGEAFAYAPAPQAEALPPPTTAPEQVFARPTTAPAQVTAKSGVPPRPPRSPHRARTASSRRTIPSPPPSPPLLPTPPESDEAHEPARTHRDTMLMPMPMPMPMPAVQQAAQSAIELGAERSAVDLSSVGGKKKRKWWPFGAR